LQKGKEGGTKEKGSGARVRARGHGRVKLLVGSVQEKPEKKSLGRW